MQVVYVCLLSSVKQLSEHIRRPISYVSLGPEVARALSTIPLNTASTNAATPQNGWKCDSTCSLTQKSGWPLTWWWRSKDKTQQQRLHSIIGICGDQSVYLGVITRRRRLLQQIHEESCRRLRWIRELPESESSEMIADRITDIKALRTSKMMQYIDYRRYCTALHIGDPLTQWGCPSTCLSVCPSRLGLVSL